MVILMMEQALIVYLVIINVHLVGWLLIYVELVKEIDYYLIVIALIFIMMIYHQSIVKNVQIIVQLVLQTDA
jgi:hypothetical protein